MQKHCFQLQLSQGKSKTTVNQFFFIKSLFLFFLNYYSYFFWGGGGGGGGGGVKQGALFGNSSYTIYCTRLQVK